MRFAGFLGIAPRYSRRQLRDGQAQVANNCVLTGGDLRPLNSPLPVGAILQPGAISVFRMEKDGAEEWLSWDRDVDVVRGPIAGDTSQRIYWTGDGEPRCSNYATATTGSPPFPVSQFVLGVFAPTAAPGVAHTGGVGTAVSRAFVYTFVNAWGEESSPSPASSVVAGKVDGQWDLTSLQTAPANTFTVTGASWSSGTATLTVSSTRGLRIGEEVGVSGVTPSGYNTARSAITGLTATTVSYAVAANPGAWSAGGTITRRASHNSSTWKQRFYWTETTASGTDYYYVGEQNAASTATVLGNTVAGELLPSAEWAMPPTNMHSIALLPNGIMVGAAGNELLLSEVNKPYAWPTRYRQTSDFDIVGVGVVGTTVVVATEGNPYTLSGVDPTTMGGGMTKIDHIWPCLAKRGVVSLGFGVAFPTPQGLALVNSSNAEIVTRDLVTQREWTTFDPSTFVAAVFDGKYIAGYVNADTDVPSVIVIDKSEPASMFGANYDVEEFWTDPLSGRLYMIRDGVLEEWSGDVGLRDLYDWWSKEIVLPRPVNLGAAKLDADFSMTDAEIAAAAAAIEAAIVGNQALIDAGQTYGALGEHVLGDYEIGGDAMADIPPESFDQLQFNLYVDNKLRFTKVVTSTRGFKLPDGYKADAFSVRISGNVRVNAIVVAETMQGLAKE